MVLYFVFSKENFIPDELFVRIKFTLSMKFFRSKLGLSNRINKNNTFIRSRCFCKRQNILPVNTKLAHSYESSAFSYLPKSPTAHYLIHVTSSSVSNFAQKKKHKPSIRRWQFNREFLRGGNFLPLSPQITSGPGVPY